MSKKLLFAMVITAVATNVFADVTTQTITTQDYVDTADALKQDKIPAAGTNEDELGESVVTYTNNDGEIGERGIYSGNWYVENRDADKLVTTDVVVKTKGCVEQMIPVIECEDYERDELGRIIGDCILVSIDYANLQPGMVCDNEDPFAGRTRCTTDSECGAGNNCCYGKCWHGTECMG